MLGDELRIGPLDFRDARVVACGDDPDGTFFVNVRFALIPSAFVDQQQITLRANSRPYRLRPAFSHRRSCVARTLHETYGPTVNSRSVAVS